MTDPLEPQIAKERTRELLRRTLGYLEAGHSLEARKAYLQAMGWARRVGNPALQLPLLRLCRQFLEPDTARRHLAQGLEMARENGLFVEEAFCLNNLVIVCMELEQMADAASYSRSCLDILEAHAPESAAVPLNNLGFLALVQGDLDAAGELLGQAARVAAEPAVSRMVRSNLAVVLARRGLVEEAIRELTLLRNERACPPSARLVILFNLARALLEAGRAEEALQEAVAPPPWLANDEPLAQAALAALRLWAHRQMGTAAKRSLQRQARILEVTTKPQAWLYRSLWARGDVQLVEL